MTERFDAERLSAHDIAVMRGRISFEEHEVRAIADKLDDLAKAERRAEQLEEELKEAKRHTISESQYSTLVRVRELVLGGNLYQLTKQDAEELVSCARLLGDIIDEE